MTDVQEIVDIIYDDVYNEISYDLNVEEYNYRVIDPENMFHVIRDKVEELVNNILDDEFEDDMPTNHDIAEIVDGVCENVAYKLTN